MAWSSGTFSRFEGTTGCADKAAASIGITAALEDQRFNEFATGINLCVTKDGQNAATANLPMGGYRHTNVGVSSALTHYGRTDQIQNGAFLWGGTTAGTANAQTATLTPAPASLVEGAVFRVKIGVGLTNTAAGPTINFNSLGAKTIKYLDGRNAQPGVLQAGAIYELLYDGTNFVVLNPSSAWAAYTATVTPQAGTFTGTSQDCDYTLINGTVGVVNTRFTGTLTVSSASHIDISLPETASNTNPGQYRAVQAIVNSVPRLCYVTRASTTVQRYVLVKDTESDVTENWPLAGVVTLTDSFMYRLA